MGMTSQSVEKLEHLLYEQSLMMMTGREKFISGVEETLGLGNDAEENWFIDIVSNS